MSEDTSEVHRAVMDGKLMTLTGILAEDPSQAFSKDQDERTPLHWACSFQRADMVKLLLNPFQVVNQAVNLSGSTGKPSGNSNNTKRIKIDIDELQDASGWTPLHIAAAVGNLDIVKLLVERDPAPDVNLQTSTGQTCLHYAVSKNHYDVACYLVRNCKASARIKDKKSQYPLHRAAAIGSIKLCQLLVKEAKAALNPKDIYSFTPLHHALAEGHGDVAIYLVKCGADYHVEDKDGNTPLDVAVDSKVQAYFKRQLEQEGYEL